MNKLRTSSRYFINAVLAAVLSIFIPSLIFWGIAWLLELSFAPLGYLQVIVDLLDFSRCATKQICVMQSILLLCVLAMPLLVYKVADAFLNSR
jgi:hypothetical protein